MSSRRCSLLRRRLQRRRREFHSVLPGKGSPLPVAASQAIHGCGYAGSYMSVVISLLRSVNLGGHNAIRMEGLRAVYQSVGLENPQSYIQSGNVIFRTGEKN